MKYLEAPSFAKPFEALNKGFAKPPTLRGCGWEDQLTKENFARNCIKCSGLHRKLTFANPDLLIDIGVGINLQK